MLLFVAICLHIALCLSVSSTGVAENDDDDRWRRVGNEQRTNRAIGAGSGRRAVWFVVTVVTPHSSYNTHIASNYTNIEHAFWCSSAQTLLKLQKMGGKKMNRLCVDFKVGDLGLEKIEQTE